MSESNEIDFDDTMRDTDAISSSLLVEGSLRITNPESLPQKSALDSYGEFYLEFESRFWPPSGLSFGLLWNEVDLKRAVEITRQQWTRGVFLIAADHRESNVLRVCLTGRREIDSAESATAEEIESGIGFVLGLFRPAWKPSRILSAKRYLQLNFRKSFPKLKHFLEFRWFLKSDLLDGQAAPELVSDDGDKAVEQSARENGTECVDVLILGAGLAGLGAAISIHESAQRLSFLVLEAEHRPGGRVNTLSMNDFPHHRRITDNTIDMDRREIFQENRTVDSGAQWLHGKLNRLHDFAEKFDLLSEEQSEEGLGAFLYENFVGIDCFLVKKVDFIVGELLGECEVFAQRQQSEDDVPRSVGEFLRKRFDEYLETLEDPVERRTSRDLFDWHWRFQVIDNSCLSLDQLSAKHWGKYSFNGESCQAHYNFREGFSSIASRLEGELGSDVVRYGKEVTKISFNANAEPTVEVKCADGSVYSAHHVLVTFSLGVLKANQLQLFEPALPPLTQRAIEALGFETINKIFLQFEEAWWGDMGGIQLIFEQGDSEVTFSARFENRWTLIELLFQTKNWTKYMTGFDILSPGAPNTLIGWVGGKGAVEMELLTDREIVEDCMKLLAKFMKTDIQFPIRYFW